MKLTDRAIEALPPPEKNQKLYFDTHKDAPSGFALRITKAGGKAFILNYKYGGYDRRKTIGAFPTWAVIAARMYARDCVQKINQGIDPFLEKERGFNEPKVSQVINEFIAKHVVTLKSSKTVISYLKNDFEPDFGRRFLKDVSRREVITLIEKKALVAPSSARQLLIYVKKVFEFSMDRDYIESSPVLTIKPNSIKSPKNKKPLAQKKRLRTLDEEELKAFWNFNPSVGLTKLIHLALKFTLVTGQRPNECSGLNGAEIQDDNWIIPAHRRGKNEIELRVPLSNLALKIIKEAEIENERLKPTKYIVSNKFLFNNSRGTAPHASTLAHAVKRNVGAFMCKVHSEFGHWTPHDLRRTCRTGLSQIGIDSQIAELVIGHERRGIIANYDQFEFEKEKRDALNKWAAHILDITSKPEG